MVPSRYTRLYFYVFLSLLYMMIDTCFGVTVSLCAKRQMDPHQHGWGYSVSQFAPGLLNIPRHDPKQMTFLLLTSLSFNLQATTLIWLKLLACSGLFGSFIHRIRSTHCSVSVLEPKLNFLVTRGQSEPLLSEEGNMLWGWKVTSYFSCSPTL